MTKYTAEDFKYADFAMHPVTGSVASKGRMDWKWVLPGWYDTGDVSRLSDQQMADAGWSIVRDAKPLTAREHLDAAWEKAYTPEDGIIPAESEYIAKYRNGRMSGPFRSSVQLEAPSTIERRLLDPPAPARPEGAEEWEDWLIEAMPHESMPDEDIARLADQIATRAAQRDEEKR